MAHRQTVREPVIEVGKLGEKIQILPCETFHGVSWDTTMLFFDYVTLQGLFAIPDVHIRARSWENCRHFDVSLASLT